MQKRSQTELNWLFGIIDFNSFSGKRVLEVGFGAGYDAYAFCKHGAHYFGVDIAFENAIRCIKHLSYYNLTPQVIQGDAENIPFKNSTFDYYFSFGVLHHTPDFEKALHEAARVLKPGAGGVIIVYNRNSIIYWINIFLLKYLLRGKFLRSSLSDVLSEIEYTHSECRPLVRVYTKRQLRKTFEKTESNITSMKVRKLLKEDLPRLKELGTLFYNLIPEKIFYLISRHVGWYIIVEFCKK